MLSVVLLFHACLMHLDMPTLVGFGVSWFAISHVSASSWILRCLNGLLTSYQRFKVHLYIYLWQSPPWYLELELHWNTQISCEQKTHPSKGKYHHQSILHMEPKCGWPNLKTQPFHCELVRNTSSPCAFENKKGGSFIPSITTPNRTVQCCLEPFKWILMVHSPWFANGVAKVRSKNNVCLNNVHDIGCPIIPRCNLLTDVSHPVSNYCSIEMMVLSTNHIVINVALLFKIPDNLLS